MPDLAPTTIVQEVAINPDILHNLPGPSVDVRVTGQMPIYLSLGTAANDANEDDADDEGVATWMDVD
ncbi:hypothetical protein F5J12DRAFT_898265 [Pisolithus orientalis]|uniref:uncharacterized protein n=1 Tax=Pisolithus orientalis TaxID=936130 RepID=UPI002223F506|nr:uncharacterized protein F5J12DRAFT_898265 [Pisolithus orientalis]KAI5988243.1 hypothetical protein F5J12DRAFT_898265 [Pisolithus orientalis]